MKTIILDQDRKWPIYADFNAQDEDGSIRLFSPHPTLDLRKYIDIPKIEGEKIWISDGEIEMIGTLTLRDGIWVAVPGKEGVKYVDESSSYYVKKLKKIKK